MFAVRYATRHFNMSSRPVYIGIAFTWLYGTILASLNFAFLKNFTYLRAYTVILFIFSFVVPLCIILVSYALIFHAANSMMQADPDEIREVRVAKTISIIISLFVLCWMPFFILNLFFMFATGDVLDKAMDHKWVIDVVKIFHYSNSMMNFFVYTFRSPDFRTTFKALMFKCDTTHVRERLRTFSHMSAETRPVNKRASTLSTRGSNNTMDGNSNPSGSDSQPPRDQSLPKQIALQDLTRLSGSSFMTTEDTVSFATDESVLLSREASPNSKRNTLTVPHRDFLLGGENLSNEEKDSVFY